MVILPNMLWRRHQRRSLPCLRSSFRRHALRPWGSKAWPAEGELYTNFGIDPGLQSPHLVGTKMIRHKELSEGSENSFPKPRHRKEYEFLDQIVCRFDARDVRVASSFVLDAVPDLRAPVTRPRERDVDLYLPKLYRAFLATSRWGVSVSWYTDTASPPRSHEDGAINSQSSLGGTDTQVLNVSGGNEGALLRARVSACEALRNRFNLHRVGKSLCCTSIHAWHNYRSIVTAGDKACSIPWRAMDGTLEGHL